MLFIVAIPILLWYHYDSCHLYLSQAVLLCHDKVSTHDLYLPTTRFHRAAQDPVDIVLSDSVYNFQAPDQPLDSTIPLSRDVPSCRKEDATIVFLERSNRPLVSTLMLSVHVHVCDH